MKFRKLNFMRFKVLRLQVIRSASSMASLT